MYPENTLLAFEKAAAIESLTGIELDIQLTKDGHIVVFHDEKIDRTTDGSGDLRNYALSELKKFKINAGNGTYERIPTIEEVLDLLYDKMRRGLKLNIELKNSICPYEGMEQKIIEIVHKRGIQKNVVYSSFSALSLEKIRSIDSETEIGILDTKVSDCLFKLKGGCGANALHPYWKGMDLPIDRFEGFTVRAWFTGHLYPDKPTGAKLNLDLLENEGITDVFLNEPEAYLS